MAVPRIGGNTGQLPLPNPGLQQNVTVAGSAPFTAGFYTGFTNTISLSPGQVYMIPGGTWWVKPGPYTFLQWLDPVTATTQVTGGVTGLWRTKPCAAEREVYVESDGSNFRLANLTGCAIGAVITTGGATNPYTNGIGSTATGVSVIVSSGASKWVPVVGGAVIATLATLTGTTTAGTGYNFPPIAVVDAPPPGGLQATAYVSGISSGTVPVANVVIANQGAGYRTAPNITLIPDPREINATTPGPTVNAVVVTTLTATGQLTGLYPYDHGTALTGVPTLTMTTATTTALATAIMNWTVTAFALASTTTQGSTLGAGTYVVSVSNTISASTNFITNPLHNGVQVTFPRPARIMANISSGVITSTGQVIEDGGLGIQQVPSTVVIPVITSSTSLGPLGGLGVPTVGGVNDTSFIQAS